MVKIKIKEEIEVHPKDIFELNITKFGNSAHIIINKKFIGKKAIIIIYN